MRGSAVAGVSVLDASGSQEIRARLVIGADGLRSVIARRLGVAHSLRWPRRLALVTHYANVEGVGEHGEMHVERDGYVGIADVGDGLTTVALVVPARRSREISGDRGAFLESWLRARPHLAPRFARATRATPVVATGPFASHARRAWAPGVALVGDAADFFDPFTGEGIYAALRGGELLAPHLLNALRGPAKDESRLLSRYDGARKREFGGKWKLERIVGMSIAHPYFLNNAAKVLSRRKDLADLLVGVAGDFVPPKVVLNPRFLFNLFISPAFRN
jgi:flavin-dependent dehydrogenase